jgi:hypothetical protein
MPFYQYIHGAKGYAYLRIIGIGAGTSGSLHNKYIALVPLAASVAWDEGFDYIPIHEGYREMYAQAGGARLGTWSFRGIVVEADTPAASDWRDAFTAIDALVANSLMQGGNNFFNTMPAYGVELTLADGSSVVVASGIVLTATLNAPVEGILTVDMTGLLLRPAKLRVSEADTSVSPTPVLNASQNRKKFVRGGRASITLAPVAGGTPLTNIHPLTFDVTVMREPQVVYSFGNPDEIVWDESKAYGEIYGSREFVYPLVISQGICSVGATMVTESRILQRAIANASGSFTFVEKGNVLGSSNTHSGEPFDVVAEWGVANGTLRLTIYRTILVGKRMFTLARPRVPYLITIRPASGVPVGTQTQPQEKLIEFARVSGA